VCCSVLQCVQFCCSATKTLLPFISNCVNNPTGTVCSTVLQCIAVYCRVLQCVAVYCSVLQCVAVCCSVLQCVAVCCSVLRYIAVFVNTPTSKKIVEFGLLLNVLQHIQKRSRLRERFDIYIGNAYFRVA